MRDVVVIVLVGAGVAIQVFACLGVVLMRDALDRLHYVGAAAVGVPCVCAGVVVREGAVADRAARRCSRRRSCSRAARCSRTRRRGRSTCTGGRAR